MIKFISKNHNKIIGALFIFAISLTAHIQFSMIGFVPTDDGFLLAYSKRIIDGQMPYRDFLSAHNIGTPLIFTPFVYFGGDYTFWISRFIVWLEFTLIAWIWLSMTSKIFKNNLISNIYKVIIAALAFFFTAHSFPPMVWYTIDGLFFYSVGLYFSSISNKLAKGLGYFLIGFIFIIKQNFIFLLPLTIILLEDWKLKRNWLFLLMPSMIYYSFFLLTGNINHLISQTFSRTEFLQTAIQAYWSIFTFPWGIIIGFVGYYYINRTNLFKIVIGLLILYFPIFYSVINLNRNEKFIYDISFLLFGVLFGMILFSLWNKKNIHELKFPTLGLFTAWTASISGGYNTPALASGIIFLSILHLIDIALKNDKKELKLLRNLVIYLVIILFPLALYNFYYTRTHNIYGEPKSADQIVYKIDNLLAGGKNILASEEIYLKLTDLRNSISIAQKINNRYAVLSSYPAIWVKSNVKNPLLMDFPFILYGQKPLVNRLSDQLRLEKDKLVIIVEKSTLKQKQMPSYGDIFQIALLVPKYYRLVDETKYFYIYK